MKIQYENKTSICLAVSVCYFSKWRNKIEHVDGGDCGNDSGEGDDDDGVDDDDGGNGDDDGEDGVDDDGGGDDSEGDDDDGIHKWLTLSILRQRESLSH